MLERPSIQKDTGRRDDRHGGLLFPPERDEHGLAFRLCKEKSLILMPKGDF